MPASPVAEECAPAVRKPQTRPKNTSPAPVKPRIGRNGSSRKLPCATRAVSATALNAVTVQAGDGGDPTTRHRTSSRTVATVTTSSAARA